MKYVAIDTDVASAAFRDRFPAPVKARLTFVTLGELTKWTVIRAWGPRRITDLETWRQQHALVLPVSPKVSVTWGLVRARAQKRGRLHPVNDTLIAASCIALNVPLITFNLKDFEDFAEHEGLQLI